MGSDSDVKESSFSLDVPDWAQPGENVAFEESESQEPPWMRDGEEDSPDESQFSLQSPFQVELSPLLPTPRPPRPPLRRPLRPPLRHPLRRQEDHKRDESSELRHLEDEGEEEKEVLQFTPRKRKQLYPPPDDYCRKKKRGTLRMAENPIPTPKPPRPPKRKFLSEAEKQAIKDHCAALNPHDRQVLFSSKETKFGVCGGTCKNVYYAADISSSKPRGSPQKLPDERFQAIYDDVVQARLDGLCFTQEELHDKVVEECHAHARRTGSSPPSARSIANYISRDRKSVV